jgi:hypothetical protein
MRGLAFYNNAAHPVICEGWHFTTMLLTQLYVRVGILQQCVVFFVFLDFGTGLTV